jgi:transposase InsO family protein
VETEWVVSRVALYQTWREHPQWSTSQLAQAVKRSVSWVKKWRNRFREQPLKAEVFRSRSRRPKQVKPRIHPLVVEAILSLRDSLSEQYHRRAGAKLILYHLHEDEHLKAGGYWLPRSTKTIRRILKAHGRIRPKPVVIHVPVERPAPMAEWELDFAETHQYGGEAGSEFLVVVDRGTSILVHTEARSGFHAHTALQSIAELFLLKGLPQRVRFDRDSRLFGSWTRDSYPSPLVRFLRCLGIEPVICPPRRPDLKPFVERCIRTLKDECLRVHRPNNLPLMNSQLEEFGHFYNNERPHQGLSCQNQAPYRAFPQLPALPELPEMVDPDRWLQAYHGRVYRRHVNANGSVMIDRYRYYLGKAYAGQWVAFHLDARRGMFQVQLNGRVIAQFAVQGLHTTHLPLQAYLDLMMQEAQSIEQFRLQHWAKDTRQTIP